MPSNNLLRLAVCTALLSTSTTYVFASSDDEKSSDSYSSYSSSKIDKYNDSSKNDGNHDESKDKESNDSKDKNEYDSAKHDDDSKDDDDNDESKDKESNDSKDKDEYDSSEHGDDSKDDDGHDYSKVEKSNGDNECGASNSQVGSICDSWQGTYNYDMYDGNENIDYGLDGSLSSVSVDGVGIAVSTWSDTEKSGGNWLWGYDYDGVEKQNNLSRYSDGYGLVNDRESSSDYTQHTMDNRDNDFDMILLSFDQAVSLSGATFSYAENYGANQQVTVVGLNNIDTFTGTETFTWNTIAEQVSSLGSSYSATFNIEQCDDTYVSEFTNLTGSAQYWLVGAYNTAFGYIDDFTAGDDSFKLASVGFTTTNAQKAGEASEVSTPATLGIFSIAAGLLMWRRKKAETAK